MNTIDQNALYIGAALTIDGANTLVGILKVYITDNKYGGSEEIPFAEQFANDLQYHIDNQIAVPESAIVQHTYETVAAKTLRERAEALAKNYEAVGGYEYAKDIRRDILGEQPVEEFNPLCGPDGTRIHGE